MTNRGVEVSLAADVIQHKDFVWSVNANVSYNRNKMTKLYSGVSEYELSSTNTKLVVGHSFGEFYLNRFAGVNPANGDALWYTKEGELTTELRDEDKVMARQELRGALAGRLRHDAGLEGTFAVGTVQLGRRPLDDQQRPLFSTSRTADSPPTTSPSACSTAGRNPATSPTSRATASTPSSTTACWRTLRSCA